MIINEYEMNEKIEEEFIKFLYNESKSGNDLVTVGEVQNHFYKLSQEDEFYKKLDFQEEEQFHSDTLERVIEKRLKFSSVEELKRKGKITYCLTPVGIEYAEHLE